MAVRVRPMHLITELGHEDIVIVDDNAITVK